MPLYINNNNKYRRLNLLYNVNLGNIYSIFKLFFTNELLNKLVNFTNRYIELYLILEDK